MERLNEHWKTIVIGPEKCSVRCCKEEETFEISLTNLREIWTERLDKNLIIRRCEMLNPSLCIEEIDVVQFVGELLKNIESYAVKKSVECIELAKNLDGGIFKFCINLEKGNPQKLWEEVTMPLCLVAGELQRRQNILLDLVRRKDEEITEYKLNGAELTRKHITTEPFDRKMFERNAPKLNTEGVFEAFKNVMETRASGETCIKLEAACSTKRSNCSKKSRKIEETNESEAEDEDLVTKNAVVGNCEATETDEEARGSSTISPKVETVDVKIEKIKKFDDSEKNETIVRKKARSAPSLSFKRTRNTIHDFIK